MTEYSKDFLLGLYRTMLRIRLCEESLIEPILSGDVRTPCHLYSGEEAVATGVCAALSEADYIFGTHRSHGHYLAKGGDMNELIAEIFGKVTGCCSGRGGSMHVIDPEKGMAGAAPIVAGTISLALGAGLAAKVRKNGKVAVCFFGDGATGEGVLYESLNFAALKKLPVIFVCENNYYSTHMPIRECRPNDNISKIAEPFGISSFRIDGNDVLEVYKAGQKAVELCKTDKGPVFMECITYRLRGHVGPDDNIQGTHTDIRPEEEIEEWRKRDPIINFEKYLVKNNVLRKKEIDKILHEVEKEVEQAHLFTKNSPYPKEEDLELYVFRVD